jgi:hypothetical protein
LRAGVTALGALAEQLERAGRPDEVGVGAR